MTNNPTEEIDISHIQANQNLREMYQQHAQDNFIYSEPSSLRNSMSWLFSQKKVDVSKNNNLGPLLEGDSDAALLFNS
jgi:uncharacterized membrane protein